MFKTKRAARALLMITLSIGSLCGNTYDFFKETPARIEYALDSLKTYLSLSGATIQHDREFSQFQEVARTGSLQELADQYEKLGAHAPLKVLQVPDVHSQAAFMSLFLEKMREQYQAHLDAFESAVTYWKWAVEHPKTYAASRLPHRWFCGTPAQAESEQKYTLACKLRDTYSAEFGALIRLLMKYYDDTTDSATWLFEVRAHVLSQMKEQDCNDTELARYLVAREEQMVASITEVAVPGWAQRHWIMLTLGAVATGAAGSYYYNNQALVGASVSSLTQSSYTFWKDSFLTPMNNFKNRVFSAFGLPVPPAPAIDGTALDQGKQAASNSRITYILNQEFIDWFFKYWGNKDVQAQEIIGRLYDITIRIDEILKVVVSAGLAYGGYRISKGTFNWFTKRDRRQLVHRLCQAEQVLIRTQHSELSDAEYGRWLYLLTKEHDQIGKNVFSDERGEFLDDLKYLADARSSVMQKQKTLDTMWRKYRSLTKTA